MTITAPTTMATPCCCHCLVFLPTKPSRASTPSLLRSMLLKCTGVLSSSKLKGKITVWFFLRRVNQKEALLGFSLLSFQFSVATTSNTMSFSLAQASRSVSLHVLSFLFVFWIFSLMMFGVAFLSPLHRNHNHHLGVCFFLFFFFSFFKKVIIILKGHQF